MDYRINKSGDNWNFLPEKERKKKKEYEKLVLNIERKEKKIERTLEKINEDKKLLKQLKKDRTKGYREMVKYHKKFSPSFSISLNSGEKIVEYRSGKMVETKGNNQWEMWVSIGGKRKYVYLGTVSSVNHHLDLLENNTPNYNKENKYKETRGYYEQLKPLSEDEDKELIKSKLESYITDVIKNKMIRILNKDGNLNRFFDKKNKIKGVKILYDLYKKTPHYEPPQEVREKKKGGRLRSLKVGVNRVRY